MDGDPPVIAEALRRRSRIAPLRNGDQEDHRPIALRIGRVHYLKRQLGIKV